MSSKTKISSFHPRNKSDASAANASEKSKEFKRGLSDGIGGIAPSDKKVYKTIQDAVYIAQQSIQGNLKYSSEVLCDILYKNLTNLISDTFNQSEFVDEIVQGLVDGGCVIGGGSESADEKSSETITEDDKQSLGDEITSAIELLKAQKDSIIEELKSVDGKTQKSELKNSKSNVISQNQVKQFIEKVKSSQHDTVEEFFKEGDFKDIESNLSQVFSALKGISEDIDDSSQDFEDQIDLANKRNSAIAKKSNIRQRGYIGRKIDAAKSQVKYISWRISQGKVASGVKLFGRASNAVGHMAYNATTRVAKGIGNTIASRGTNITKPTKRILSTSVSASLTKIGLKAAFVPIKSIGKKLWGGIKRIAFRIADVFKGLFNIGVKFVNKVQTYSMRIRNGVKKAYNFLIKPIAEMLVDVFGFTVEVVKHPVNFIKQTIPMLSEKFKNSIHLVKEKLNIIRKKTWGVLKKILFNPITMTILIGGIAFFVIPKVIRWITGGWKGIRESIVKPIIGFAKGAWSFISGVFSVVKTVGVELFNVVEWITRPEGILAKALVFGFKTVMLVKKFITKLVKASGKSGIDTFCMFLAGDYLGLAIHSLAGFVRNAWRWLVTTRPFKVLMNAIKSFLLFGEMWATWHVKVVNGIFGFAKSILFGDSPKDALQKLVEPFTNWWSRVKGIWSDSFRNDTLSVDPIEQAAETNEKMGSSINNLNMKGKMDALKGVNGFQGSKSVVDRLKYLSKIQGQNSEQAQNYNKFLADIWDNAHWTDDAAYKAVKALLENPVLSYRLMSSFYYYDPHSGEVMCLFPQSHLNGFLNNIRNLVSDNSQTWQKKLKIIVEAFDQVNKERMNLVNKQAKSIGDFADRINAVDLNQKGSDQTIANLVKELESGSFLDTKTSALNSFKDIKNGNAQTKQIESVTGENLGTNELLKNIKPVLNKGGKEKDVSAEDLKVKPPTQSDLEKGAKILLPPSMTSSSRPITIEYGVNQEKSLKRKYDEYINENGNNDDQISFDEFKRQYAEGKIRVKNGTDDSRASNLSGMRLEQDIASYNSQGRVANPEGFKFNGRPSILNVQADGLSQTMLIYSPEWRRIHGASKRDVSDAELLQKLKMNEDEQSEQERQIIEKEIAEKEQKKREEDELKQREKEILDYSAKIDEGFIEIKIGEDLTLMHRAWDDFNKKRFEMISKIGQRKAEQMGFVNYSWEEWQKYYRRTHGMPEDGIKRIPLETIGKKRNVDMSPRSAFTSEEISKYGIKVSEDGPVMIPLKNAMEISSSILNGAKSIYSVRDGLEVMRKGLDAETQTMKQKRTGGQMVRFGAIKL